jgi:hypothetical protein
MPRIKTILCSGICFFYITALPAQVLPPKNKTISNVVGYQVYQQKLWSMKQLPKNSVLYQYNSRYIFHHDSSPASSSRLAPVNISFADHSLVPHLSISEKLQSNLRTIRYQNYKWQKQSWWRDPSKGTGALLLKNILSNNNGFIHQ